MPHGTPRIARLRMDDVATHVTNFLEWVVEAVDQDTPAGSPVTVTITRSVLGVPPDNPTSLTLRYTTDANVVIRSVTLDVSAPSQTDTFYFTHNGTAAGTSRCGTVEIKLQATRSSPVTYDVETDGAPNTPPAGFDTHLQRGWIRSTTTATTFLSNVSFGGAKPAPFAHDDDIYHRAVLGAVPYKSETVTHTTTPDPGITGTSASATATFDRQFINVVDNRFPATQVVESATVTFANSPLSELPWTVATITMDWALFDPRLTVTHLLQINESVYGTPPAIRADPDDIRLTSELGFLSFRLTNARGEGRNGLAVTEEIRDVAGLLGTGDFPSRSVVTVAAGGQDGWAESFMAWQQSLPAGAWLHSVFITTTDSTGLEKDNTRNYTLKGQGYEVDPVDLAFNGTLSLR